MDGDSDSVDNVELRTLTRDEVAARHTDLSQLLTLAIKNAGHSSFPDVNEEVASTLALAQKATNYVTVVAEVSNQTVGLLVGQLDRDLEQAFVHWIAVCPSQQRQGIGTDLADFFDDMACTGSVRGSVDPQDPVAVAFWERRGWNVLYKPPSRIPMGKSLGNRHANSSLAG